MFAIFLLFVLTACSDSSSPEGGSTKVTTVDDFLERVCDLAGECGPSTQEDIDLCPANLLEELDADDIAALEAFTELTKEDQDRVFECLGEEICGRFGGSVLNMSDSDLMEPFRGCGGVPFPGNPKVYPLDP